MLKPKFTLKDLPNANLDKLADLTKLEQLFVKSYGYADLLHEHRSNQVDYSSNDLIKIATDLQDFIAEQFYIEDQVDQQLQELQFNAPIIAFKKIYVQKYAKRLQSKLDELPTLTELEAWRQSQVPQIKDQEWATADYALKLTDEQEKTKLKAWCARALSERPELITNWVSFLLPQKLDPDNLLALTSKADGTLAAKKTKARFGFDHTSKLYNSRKLSDEANYCIVCHPKQGDFCRIGFPIKKGEPEFKVNSLNQLLTGCPLEQHISEMNQLLQLGLPIAALAVAMINNPMIAATGHRICHDCMSACIYQKQTPVDIPNIESKLLDMVLNLPFGVEIYYLLTRWNPMRLRQWLPKPFNGHKVAIMGMGPAGFTMAHHLLMEGCAVVGLDGQAMTAMPKAWLQPIYTYQDLRQALPLRESVGFGGVAEYGITARWDKNLLSIIRLVLTRNSYFQCYSSVRFGGNWSLPDAWRQGFSHVVLAVGAGLPNVPNIPGSLAPGMRTANDFLMALHLGLAARSDSGTSLEVRLPAVVIGAGLTAIDTATELQAYYLELIDKVAQKLDGQFADKLPELAKQFSQSEWQQILTWFAHGRALRKEQRLAITEMRPPNLIKLLHEFGGVTVVYRRRLQEAPAYRENYQELASAMAEGIWLKECCEPKAVELDSDGFVAGLKVLNTKNQQIEIIPAVSVWSAIGTKLNVAYSFENQGELAKSGAFAYASYAWNTQLTQANIEHCKAGQEHNLPVFTSVAVNAGVSFIGDTHPAFHGSVVKAMASAKRAYPSIIRRILSQPTATTLADFQTRMPKLFQNKLINIKQTESGVWLTIDAPLIAEKWQPGMFCRLWLYGQDPIFLVPVSAVGSRLQIYWPQPASNILSQLKLDNIELMGPTGVRYNAEPYSANRLWFVDAINLPYVLSLLPKIDQAKLFLVIHDGPILDKSVLELLTNVNWVMAGVNASAAWAFMPHEPNYLLLLKAWLGSIKITELSIFTAPGLALALKALISDNPELLATDARLMAQAIGPMQCGLKGVCAQCLQWQVDPKTGQRTKAVYACSWQHQPLNLLDLEHTNARSLLKGAFAKLNTQ